MQLLITLVIIGVGFWVLTHLFDILATVLTLLLFLLIWIWDNIITAPFRFIGSLFGSSKHEHDDIPTDEQSDLIRRYKLACEEENHKSALKYAEQLAEQGNTDAMEHSAALSVLLASLETDAIVAEDYILKAKTWMIRYEQNVGEKVPTFDSLDAGIDRVNGRLAAAREDYKTAFAYFLNSDKKGNPIAAADAAVLAANYLDDLKYLELADKMAKKAKANGSLSEEEYEQVQAIIMFKFVTSMENN